MDFSLSLLIKYNIDVLGISECRWAGFGRMKVQTAEMLLYSGRDEDTHLLLSKIIASYLISWSLVNDQSITALFEVTLYHN